jgi:hypothetical protein
MLAAVAALLPTDVRAGCNHPWVHRAGLSDSLNDLAILDVGHHEFNADSEVPEKPGHGSPCAGGACSRLPDLPISTSGSIPGQVELWGELPAGTQSPASASDGIGFFHDRPRPTRTNIPIERPPRMIVPR